MMGNNQPKFYTDDIWSSFRVKGNDHINKVDHVLRGHKVPQRVRNKIRAIMHDQQVEMSAKIATDLNRLGNSLTERIARYNAYADRMVADVLRKHS